MATGEFMGVVTIIVLLYQIWFFSFHQDGFPFFHSTYFRQTYLANVSQMTLSFTRIKETVKTNVEDTNGPFRGMFRFI